MSGRIRSEGQHHDPAPADRRPRARRLRRIRELERVIERLRGNGTPAVAVANPLRSLDGDAAYLRDVLAAIDGPVILVGHSYGGMVITEAAAGSDRVTGVVYVCAFAPQQDESALALSAKFPGSTLADALTAHPVATGGTEFAIRPDVFHHQFAADVPAAQAAVMATTQRPVTETALTTGLPTDQPAWTSIPSWFVFSDQDLNIPVQLHRYLADRAAPRGYARCPGRHTRSASPSRTR